MRLTNADVLTLKALRHPDCGYKVEDGPVLDSLRERGLVERELPPALSVSGARLAAMLERDWPLPA